MQIDIQNMSKSFGGLRALDEVSAVARSGEVTAIIGPNGSGKSTLVNCVSGVIRPDAGQFSVDGVVQSDIIPHRLVEIGISRTFQNIRLWEHLTCREHVVLARRNYLSSARGRKVGSKENVEETVKRLLGLVGLAAKANVLPTELSYGEKRRLEIARALSIDPHLILLDEPAAGFTLSEQAALGELILDVASQGLAIILIEHHMDLVAKVSSQVSVLNFGRVLTTGSIEEIRENPEVISAYLGVSS